MNRYVIAHDLGTTGNKATLFDADGRLVGSASFGYATDFAHTGWAEQSAEDWWQAVCATTRDLLEKMRVRGDEIACLTFSGQMMGCVPLDANARALRRALIWADQRSVAQEQWLSSPI
jgi:xylulokinase